MNTTDTPETDKKADEKFIVGFITTDDDDGFCVPANFARRLERERDEARRQRDEMAEALEMAEKELVHLFTVLPVGGVLPSPSVMQHVQWARLRNAKAHAPLT